VGGYSEVLIWNVERQSLDFRVPTRGRMITDLKWASGGQLIIASGAPGRFGVLEAFDFATRKPLATFGFSRDVCPSVVASPYRNEIAAGFADGSVTLFSLDEFKPRVSSVPHAAGVTSLHWSSKNNRIFSASLDRTAKSFQATDGQVLFAYPDHERTVGGVVNSQFGPITLDETGTLRVWSEGEEVRSIAKFEGLPQRVQQIVSTNGFVFVADKDRIRRMLIVQDEVDDDKAKEKDKSESEKPKKKKRTRIQEKESMQSLPNQNISSVTTNSNGLMAAGLDTGQVVIWRIEESASPWKTWHAQP
jgi:WD40 repeat protein